MSSRSMLDNCFAVCMRTASGSTSFSPSWPSSTHTWLGGALWSAFTCKYSCPCWTASVRVLGRMASKCFWKVAIPSELQKASNIMLVCTSASRSPKAFLTSFSISITWSCNNCRSSFLSPVSLLPASFGVRPHLPLRAANTSSVVAGRPYSPAPPCRASPRWRRVTTPFHPLASATSWKCWINRLTSPSPSKWGGLKFGLLSTRSLMSSSIGRQNRISCGSAQSAEAALLARAVILA